MHLKDQTSIQTVFARATTGYVSRVMPPADQRLPGFDLAWGRAEEIGSPAYWAAQAWMSEVETPRHYKLGHSLEEELIACLIGGYGIPAEVGLAAYDRLRLVNCDDPAALLDERLVSALLKEPLMVGGKPVRYRFANQKAAYLSRSMRALQNVNRQASDKDLRFALTCLPGVGPKTASWIVRNWRDSDEVAILDVHILRAGRILQIFPARWTVEKNYYELEGAFLHFASAIGVKASLLDSVMWNNMRQLPMDILRKLADPAARELRPTQQTKQQLVLAF